MDKEHDREEEKEIGRADVDIIGADDEFEDDDEVDEDADDEDVEE